MIEASFFNRDTQLVARALLGKIIRRRQGKIWLSARIIETEAYYLSDKASHASLGYTEKRKALFMPAGTIYMYYARGKASLDISCKGKGNAVLIKSAYPWFDHQSAPETLSHMQKNHLPKEALRPIEKLCSGQTLLCTSLGITVNDWDAQQFNRETLYIEDVGETPTEIIQTRRLGIPLGRDEHLPYRFVDRAFAPYCTKNPLTARS